MTSFYLNPRDLEIWLSQNHSNYTGDFVDGCLLDNFVVSNSHGYAAFYEHAINSWTSDYLVECEASPAEELWDHWDNFVQSVKKAS